MINKELLNYTNTWIFIVLFVSSIIDIFIIRSYIDIVELALVALWIYMLKISSAARICTTPIVLLYIILIPICLTFGNELSAQKLAIWVFYIFSATIISKSISAIIFK